MLLKNGVHRAFEVLYHHYKKPLTGKFPRLLKSDDLAKDALQHLFTKIREMREHLLLGTQIDYSQIEEALVSKENIALVQQALQQLPPQEREVFVKHKLEGKSYKEISEEFGISPSAINNYVYPAPET